jgi:hypothetical protein
MLFDTHKFDPLTTGPRALFAPVVTSSRSPLLESDYNLHKSNSTYFSDLDSTRSHLVCVTLREGIRSLSKNPGQVITPDGKKAKGKWSIMLGGVACSFKREIGMYQGYEMWSRVLCWDRKWIYVISHFVQKGTVKPDGWIIDDGSLMGRLFGARSKKGKGVKPKSLNESLEIVPNIPHKALFATAISKYVMKIGRLTIHPEVVMDISGLLPPRPGGWNTMKGEKIEGNGSTTEPVEESTNGSAKTGDDWDWKRVVAENARGLEFAEHLAAMDDLHSEFTADTKPALGKYKDLFW